MIFNRVAGKDLGIDANIKVADAPVSYPFLWNASRQDRTQWNSSIPNGLYINAIGRDAGEVSACSPISPRKSSAAAALQLPQAFGELRQSAGAGGEDRIAEAAALAVRP